MSDVRVLCVSSPRPTPPEGKRQKWPQAPRVHAACFAHRPVGRRSAPCPSCRRQQPTHRTCLPIHAATLPSLAFGSQFSCSPSRCSPPISAPCLPLGRGMRLRRPRIRLDRRGCCSVAGATSAAAATAILASTDPPCCIVSLPSASAARAAKLFAVEVTGRGIMLFLPLRFLLLSDAKPEPQSSAAGSTA